MGDARQSDHADPGLLPPVPAGSSIRRLPFDASALPEVASLLAAEVEVAPFRVTRDPVYRVVVHDETNGAGTGVTTITLWFGLARVDVSSQALSAVTSGILAVDVVPGVEVIFRHAHGSVTVARGGRVMIQTGDRRVLPPLTGDDQPVV